MSVLDFIKRREKYFRYPDPQTAGEAIQALETMKYPEETFDKFHNPLNPAHEQYKDRRDEEMMDRGFNNGIDSVIFELMNYGKVRGYDFNAKVE